MQGYDRVDLQVRPARLADSATGVNLTLSGTLSAAAIASGGTLFPDGSLSAPSIAFAADTDTGYYRVGSGVIGIAANGIHAGTFTQYGIDTPGILYTGYGTASGPSHTFGGDNNTGMYHHDTDGDVLLFATGAVERLRIDANGHIGINRTPASIGDGGSPRLLQVAGYGSGAYGALNLISDQTGDGATAGAISFASSGAGSSDKRLAILLATSDGSSASGANGRLYFYTAAGGANTLALFIDSVGRIATGGMTIHSSLLRGDLVVGRSSATGSGTIYFGSNNQHAFLYYSSAQFVLGRGSAGVNSTIDNSGLTTNTSSEFVNGRRYKERRGVIDPDQAMAWLRSIPPRRYRVVNEQRERLGFFAEELHAASPYLSDGKGYTPQNLDVALVAAIQQLDRRLTARERQSA